MEKTINSSKWIIIGFVCIYALTIFLFRKSITAYFFQDDWFSFSISQPEKLSGIINFFIPQKNVVYYRPLGMQLPFFLFWKLFGINPLPFRIVTFLIHFLNGILLYQLFRFFTKNRLLSFFGSALYLTSSVHMIIFYWAATIAFVISPFFYFSSFYKYILGNKKFSLFLFIIGLFVNENLITLPFFILIWEYFFVKSKKHYQTPLIFLIISILYVLFRFFIAKFPTSGGYAFLTQPNQLFLNLRNYFLWSLNWPEEIHKQFISFFILNPEFIRNFIHYVLLFGFSSIVFIVILIIFPGANLLIQKKLTENVRKILILGILWFGMTLSPVLFFAKHYYAYYLPIPLFGLLLFCLILVNQIIKQKKFVKFLLIPVFILWYISSSENLRLNTYIHWAVQRSLLAKILITQIKSQYPVLKDHSTVIISENFGTEEKKWSLGDQNGLKIIYNNPLINTYYGTKENYLKIQENSLNSSTQKENLIEL